MTSLTKVNVQHGRVGALDEDGLSLGDFVVDVGDGLGYHGADPLRELLVPRHLRLLVYLQGGVARHVAVGQDREPEG